MNILDFTNDFAAKKIVNTKVNEHAVSDYLRRELEIRSYIPFKQKRNIAEMVVRKNIKEIDGIKRYDSIDGYIGFIVSSIAAHTNLEFSDDPVADYDLLAESGLLPHIIAEFQGSHDEIDIILKMALAMELEDNNVNALIGHFLNKISLMLDGVAEAVNDKFDDFDLSSLIGSGFKQEDFAQLMGFLDKIK